MMFHSIKLRIVFFIVLFVFICSIGSGLYITHYIKDSYLKSMKVQLTDQARLLGEGSISYFLNLDVDAMNSLARKARDFMNARVTIIDKDGVVLGDSEEDFAKMKNQLGELEIMGALSEGVGINVRRDNSGRYDVLHVAVPVTLDGKVVGICRISKSLADISKQVIQVTNVVIVAALASAVVITLLSLYIANSITLPLKKLAQTAKEMAEGKFNQKVRVDSHDEIGELANTMNQMVIKIEDTVAAVTRERDNMATVLAHMSDGIFMVDKNKRVLMMNQAAEKILEITKEKVLGHTFIEAVFDYELDGMLQRCLNSDEPQSGLVKTRANKQLGVVATPLAGKAGCMMLLQDYTKLQRVELMRRDFISNFSHELRTPISSVKAIAETLNDGAIDDPSVARKFLDGINVELDRLAQMVQELGELSRIESGDMVFRKEAFDISETIGKAIKRLKPQADRAYVTIKINIPSSLPRVFADENRIEQVLINLIHNAIKFTQANGTITISASPQDDVMLISVADTGIGISADDIPRIFERFYKVDKARSGSGTGLGLAIAKHIIESHGGKIWVESVERKGSVFNFTIPISSLN